MHSGPKQTWVLESATRLCSWLAMLCMPLLVSGCSLLAGLNATDAQSEHDWLSSGSLAISRPIPPVNFGGADRSRMRAPASLQSVRPAATILRVNRAAGRLSLEGPDTSPISFYTQVARTMKPGRYTIALKQNNPLWYAPTSYFTQRSLRVPPEGSKDRFKRGALGLQSLFLNDQTPIHSGPVGTSEIGGLRLRQEDMLQVFQAVQVGTVVDVR